MSFRLKLWVSWLRLEESEKETVTVRTDAVGFTVVGGRNGGPPTGLGGATSSLIWVSDHGSSDGFQGSVTGWTLL